MHKRSWLPDGMSLDFEIEKTIKRKAIIFYCIFTIEISEKLWIVIKQFIW